MNPITGNNREISWHYIEAPNYSGDVRIVPSLKARRYIGPAILITHLKNGIHGVQQKSGDHLAGGQAQQRHGTILYFTQHLQRRFPLLPSGSSTLPIMPSNNSREYTISIPASCGSACVDPATEVTYTTFDPNSGIFKWRPEKK